MRSPRRARKRKWRLKFIQIEKRETPKGRYTRLIVGRFIFGKNEHEFKGKMTKHYHFGEKFIKIVTKPKELRGLWKYDKKRREYVRIGRKGKGKDKRD